MSKKRIRVLADAHIYKLKEFISSEVDLILSTSIQDEIPTASVDALLIRTVSKINPNTIPSSTPITFIGTASAGFDHVDTTFLSNRGINFASAAGCNANAVAEYVLSALLIWADSKKIDLKTKTLAIIGVGHVGSQVNRLAKSFGLKTVLYDPPRQNRDSSFTSVPFSDVLDADIISFHVPLDETTHHYFSRSIFNDSCYDLVINAARGGIIDEQFLRNQINQGFIGDCIIDCWENEPDFNKETLKASFIATPHIAGYSEQAKIKATTQIVDQLHQFFGIDTSIKTNTIVENPIILEELDCKDDIDFLKKHHSLMQYHNLLNAYKSSSLTSYKYFSSLRVETPFRNEFKCYRVPSHFLSNFGRLKHFGIQAI